MRQTWSASRNVTNPNWIQGIASCNGCTPNWRSLATSCGWCRCKSDCKTKSVTPSQKWGERGGGVEGVRNVDKRGNAFLSLTPYGRSEYAQLYKLVSGLTIERTLPVVEKDRPWIAWVRTADGSLSQAQERSPLDRIANFLTLWRDWGPPFLERGKHAPRWVPCTPTLQSAFTPAVDLKSGFRADNAINSPRMLDTTVQ